MAAHVTARAAAQQFLKGLWDLASTRVQPELGMKYGYDIRGADVHPYATCVTVGLIVFGQQGTDPAFVDLGICMLRGFGSLYGHLPGTGNLYQLSRKLDADQIWGKTAQAVSAVIDDMLDPGNTEADQELVSKDDANPAAAGPGTDDNSDPRKLTLYQS